MPIPQKYLAFFEEDGIYHVYNRTNNKELLFKNEDNCSFFIDRYLRYLQPYVQLHCWCLLPNHFHFLVRVKKEETIRRHLKKVKTWKPTKTDIRFLQGECSINELIVSAFRRFFQSYALSFNKYHGRKGNLFNRPFRRVRVEEPDHFSRVVVYIHSNPQKHGVSSDFRTYAWSSFSEYVNHKRGIVSDGEVWRIFVSIEAFLDAHANWRGTEEPDDWQRVE